METTLHYLKLHKIKFTSSIRMMKESKVIKKKSVKLVKQARASDSIINLKR